MGWNPKGKNGRASPGFFLLPVCTDAESLEQFRAWSMKLQSRGFASKSRRITREASSQKFLATGPNPRLRRRAPRTGCLPTGLRVPLPSLKGKQVRFDGVDDLGQASDLVAVLLLRRRPVRMAHREQVLNVPGHHR